MQIVTFPDQRLLEKCETVTAFDENLQLLVREMILTMLDAGGVGLAAPQVGINKRIFIACHSGKLIDAYAYVNPELSFYGNETVDGAEGCLSIPDKRFIAKRYKNASISFQNEWGKKCTHIADDVRSIIWQHEFDHLDGLLINRFPERQHSES